MHFFTSVGQNMAEKAKETITVYDLPIIECSNTVNLSLTQGIFPNAWKKAEVKPIPD